MSVYFEPVVELDDGPIPIIDPAADDFHLSGHLDITDTRTRAVLALVRHRAHRVWWIADDTPLHSALGREWKRQLGADYLDTSTIPEHIPDTTLDVAMVTNIDKAEYYTSSRWGESCPLPTATESSPPQPSPTARSKSCFLQPLPGLCTHGGIMTEIPSLPIKRYVENQKTR